ncbi:MAG: prepilin-type N-terminal cleavage/methylation domain-containing protein [Syntrophobacter sp.]
MNPLCNEKGFTLVEILAAIVVFAFGMLALFKLQAATVVSNTNAHELTQAAAFAQNRLERIMTWPYDDPGSGGSYLRDTNGNGTGQDANSDGIDDNGGNFGLDDTGAAADDCITWDASTSAETGNCTDALTPGTQYRISHNIAVDQPLANTKTISVVVTWLDGKGKSHTYTLQSSKAVGY